MLTDGGWITEFLSGTVPDRENFPRRNRIVAGLAEATIVIESARKGGALITANIANSYNRDVFAVPGRVTDEKSAGCNFLIKTNRAHLLQAPEDLGYLMEWENKKQKPIQTRLFPNLSDSEEKMVSLMKEKNKLTIDEFACLLNRPISEVSTDLLYMEFKGLVRQMPGKQFELCK
jgi:DNA processing protein